MFDENEPINISLTKKLTQCDICGLDKVCNVWSTDYGKAYVCNDMLREKEINHYS